jgi:hypothetical protein
VGQTIAEIPGSDNCRNPWVKHLLKTCVRYLAKGWVRYLRNIHNAHRVELKGESLRKKWSKKTVEQNEE